MSNSPKMRILLDAGLIVLFAAFSCSSETIKAGSFEERHRQELATNPRDLTFVLRTTSREKQFHHGEMVPITLEFSSSVPNKYRLNGATYDRSGRLPTEEFVMDRTDVVDPLVDYFGSGVIGGMAGGLRGYPVLTPEPYRIDLFLNDWFRFDKPGRYRLYLKSHRLARERLSSEPGQGLIDFAAVSTMLEIEITRPDPAWEEAKLAELRAILDPPDQAVEQQHDDPDRQWRTPEPEEVQARRELSYLGTPGATHLILKLARRDPNGLDSFGLIASPHRTLVIAELDRYIEDPETIVTQWMVQLRALFDYVNTASPKPIPMYRWEYQQSDWNKLRLELDSRQKEFEGMVRRRAARLIPLIARKSDAVRQACVETITALAPEEAEASGIAPPEDFGLSRDQLIARFNEFSEDRQSVLLSKEWGLVRGPEMLPALRRLVARTPPKPLPQTATEYSLWHGAATVPEKALQRILECAAEQARQILVDDVTRPEPRFPQFAVHELPAQDIPKADAALAENLKTNPAGTIPLVAKFATVALAAQVRSVYEEQSWPCEEEQWFVAYFVRVLPAEGKDVLAGAMGARKNRGCYQMLLGNVAGNVWNRVVEQQTIATLNDPDPEAAASAAVVLARYGGAAAESRLWKRLEQWSEKWRGRAEELRQHPITGAHPNGAEERLGEALIDSITQGRAWFFDDERSRRLAALCLDDWCREMWSAWSTEPRGPWRVDASNGGVVYGLVFHVGQYGFASLKELKEKMAQFPAGTTFQWCPDPDGPFDAFIPEERQEMYTELAQFLAGRGMRIEPYSKEACRPGKPPK